MTTVNPLLGVSDKRFSELMKAVSRQRRRKKDYKYKIAKGPAVTDKDRELDKVSAGSVQVERTCYVCGQKFAHGITGLTNNSTCGACLRAIASLRENFDEEGE